MRKIVGSIFSSRGKKNDLWVAFLYLERAVNEQF